MSHIRNVPLGGSPNLWALAASCSGFSSPVTRHGLWLFVGRRRRRGGEEEEEEEERRRRGGGEEEEEEVLMSHSY
jgi:hypothetical protein